ncbi:MAG: hypothetical protein RL330_191, partial [Actinomycetota bacterium]
MFDGQTALFGEWQPWADPASVSDRRLPVRTTFTAHPTADGARHGHREQSPWWQDLSGTWRAFRFAHPRLVTRDAVASGIDTSGWHPVAVPGNWTLQGLGDLPHYTNIDMPWRGLPADLPEEIPTVVHRRTFEVPATWRDRRVVLHVGGAESVHGVWVNGEYAGWGTDSRLSSEYDVTDLVREGTNLVALVVSRFSAQSYLEDQDQWWMAG